jgi:hypothetical protein
VIEDAGKREAEAESLNLQLESAWCRIADLRNGAKFYVYLTASGRLVLRKAPSDGEGARVGYYGASTGLLLFRARVFEVYEQQVRGKR